jgi:hypothetical protein
MIRTEKGGMCFFLLKEGREEVTPCGIKVTTFTSLDILIVSESKEWNRKRLREPREGYLDVESTRQKNCRERKRDEQGSYTYRKYRFH